MIEKYKYYINLTNGIEYLQNIMFRPHGYIRIQSTKCEQKEWDFIIQELDYSFLLDIVLGTNVIVYDMGASKNKPRAMYQGLEFIKFVLNKYFLDKDTKPIVRGVNCYKYFFECYKKLDKRTLKKLEYFKKFLNTNEIKLSYISDSTCNDNNYNYYRDILISRLK